MQDDKRIVFKWGGPRDVYRLAAELARLGFHRRHGRLVHVVNGEAERLDATRLKVLLSESIRFQRESQLGEWRDAGQPPSLLRTLPHAEGLSEWMPGGPLDEARIVWVDDPKRFRYVREMVDQNQSRRAGMVKTPHRVVAYAELLADAARGPIGGYRRRYWHVMPHDASEDTKSPYGSTGMPSEGVEPSNIVLGHSSFER